MSWINRISDSINKVFSAVRAPLGALPPILLICEVHNRPGLSAIVTTSSIIKRLSEANIESGVNKCGLPNKTNKLVRIFIEELVKEIKDNARATCVMETSKLNSQSVGGNAVVNSINTLITSINGIIQ